MIQKLMIVVLSLVQLGCSKHSANANPTPAPTPPPTTTPGTEQYGTPFSGVPSAR